MVHHLVAHLSKEELVEALTKQLGRFTDTRSMNTRVVHRAPHSEFGTFKKTTLECEIKFKLPKKLNEAMNKARKECAQLAKDNKIVIAKERVRRDKLHILKCISVDQWNYFEHFVDYFLANGGNMNPNCQEVSDIFYRSCVPYLFDYYGVDMKSGEVPVPIAPTRPWQLSSFIN